MEKKYYIKMMEESSEDGVLCENWRPMNFFKKLFLNWCAKEIVKTKTDLEKEITDLRNNNNELSGKIDAVIKQIGELSQKLDTVSTQLEKTKTATKQIRAEYNTQKASIDSMYKGAIDCLYDLRNQFENNVSKFGKDNRLDVLQMLVHYLYDPKDSLKDAIYSRIENNNDKALDILGKIVNFNDTYREKLIAYLADKGFSWEQCVLFPEKYVYDPTVMAAFNDLEIIENSPIYVVALGYQFPGSNSENHRPVVFANKSNNI